SSDKIRPTDDQVFIFQFNEDRNESELGEPNIWFRYAESPKEFGLAKLKQKKAKNRRQVIISKQGLFSPSMDGINPKKTIALHTEDLGGGKFKVRPVVPLSPGEYFFFYQGTIEPGKYQDQ